METYDRETDARNDSGSLEQETKYTDDLTALGGRATDKGFGVEMWHFVMDRMDETFAALRLISWTRPTKVDFELIVLRFSVASIMGKW